MSALWSAGTTRHFRRNARTFDVEIDERDIYLSASGRTARQQLANVINKSASETKEARERAEKGRGKVSGKRGESSPAQFSR